jgi:hypothetical protein
LSQGAAKTPQGNNAIYIALRLPRTTKGQQTCWPLKVKNQKFANLVEVLSRFCSGAQTTRAEFYLTGLTIFNDRNLLNVRFPLSFGVTHRVADIVTTQRLFTTIIAFSHDESSLF